MPIGYLVAISVTVVGMLLALVPLRRSGPLGILSWLVSAGPNESPFVVSYWILAVTVLALIQGDLDSPLAWFGLALAGGCTLLGGLVVIRRSLYPRSVRRTRSPRTLGAVLLSSALALSCQSDDGGEQAAEPTNAVETSAGEPATSTTSRPNATTGTSSGPGRYSGLEVVPEVVRQVEPSVVAIQFSGGEGSGVVYGTDGTIVTNHHVVSDGSQPIEVTFADGKRSPAAYVASDPLLDLSIIRADRGDVPAARFAAELPDVGELAIAVGNPLGFENTVTAGIVSGLHRNIPGSAVQSQALIDLIQTDAAISPGNSGGALANGRGEVIGVNVAYIPPQAAAVSIGFAIPSPTVNDAVRQLLDSGRVKHGYLGLQPAPLTPEVVDQLGVGVDEGVLVLAVVPGGPAAQGGLQPGDIVTALDGSTVPTVEDFLARLRQVEPGSRVTLAVVRGDRRQDVAVTVQDRPALGG